MKEAWIPRASLLLSCVYGEGAYDRQGRGMKMLILVMQELYKWGLMNKKDRMRSLSRRIFPNDEVSASISQLTSFANVYILNNVFSYQGIWRGVE